MLVQFAIQSNDIHIYSTKNSFNEIEDFSNEALNEWRSIELRKFIEFSKTIQTKMNPYKSKQIHEFIELFEKQKEEQNLLHQYGSNKYKAIMLISAANRGDTKKVTKLIKSGSFVDAQLQDGVTALFMTAAWT